MRGNKKSIVINGAKTQRTKCLYHFTNPTEKEPDGRGNRNSREIAINGMAINVAI
jgi:hypothetical protein